MAATFAQMIQSAFPDAQTGKDFTFRSDAEGHPEIDYWNSEKLGPEPNLTSLHAEYMKRIRKRKEIMPNIDDGDPAPWLNRRTGSGSESMPTSRRSHRRSR